MKSDNTSGHITLQSISHAGKFNGWMFKAIRPYLKGNILEIGSGIGNISQFLLKEGYTTTLSDIDELYLAELNEKFHSFTSLAGIVKINLEDPQFRDNYKESLYQFDTVFVLNVLEHLDDDSAAIQNVANLLKPGGTLLVLAPAYPSLYGPLDRALGHRRRYTLKELDRLFTDNNFTVQEKTYFNALGIPAWWYGKILRLKNVPSGEMKLYDYLTPLAKWTDKIIFNKMGLSIIIVGIKK